MHAYDIEVPQTINKMGVSINLLKIIKISFFFTGKR